MSNFWKGFEKTAVSKKWLDRAGVAAFRRAGHNVKAEDIPSMGLSEYTYPIKDRLHEPLKAARYRIKMLQGAFPKGKKLSKAEANARYNISANDSHNNWFDEAQAKKNPLRAKLRSLPGLKEMEE